MYDFSPFKIINVGNSHCDGQNRGIFVAHLPEKQIKKSGMILNENELETDRKTPVQHTESGRKDREVIRSGPVPLERGLRGNWD